MNQLLLLVSIFPYKLLQQLQYLDYFNTLDNDDNWVNNTFRNGNKNVDKIRHNKNVYV